MATSIFAGLLQPRQWFDDDGNPLNGGRIFVYLAGTSTPDTSYGTQAAALAGTPAQTNPVDLDSAGRADIWLQSGRLYKIVANKSVAAGGAQVGSTLDNYSPAAAQQFPTLEQWVVDSTIPTFISGVQMRFVGIDLSARYVTGRRVLTTNTGGSVYSTVASGTFSAGNTDVILAHDSGTLDAGLSRAYFCLTTPPGQATAPPGIGDRTSFVKAYLAANQAILTGAFRKINFETEIQDLLAEYDAAVNFRFTPLYQSTARWNKRYLFTANITLDTSIVSASLALARNGTNIHVVTQNMGIAGGSIQLTWQEEQQQSTGNFYEIFVSPSGNVTVRGGITATTFSVTAIP